MLSLIPLSESKQLIGRRNFLRFASLGLAGLAMPKATIAGTGDSSRPKAKSCIFIFLCGGPSQPDLWDLKPNAPDGIRSVFKPIQSSVPGIHFGELIPQVARHADKLAIIRSMTHDDNGHGTAIARSLLGQLPAIRGTEHASRSDHPGLGAILPSILPSRGEMPPWVVLPRPFTTGGPSYKGQSGGFLGAAHDPVLFNKPKQRSLSDDPVDMEALRFPDGMSNSRFQSRREMLKALNATSASMQEAIPAAVLSRHAEMADHLLSSGAVNRAFDLTFEPAKIRDRYGRNEYGQSLLLARRLVESGVRVVNVFWTFFDDKGCQFNLWDNHGVETDVCGVDRQLSGEAMLKHSYCCPSFDRSFSALLEDLHQRGLLDETLIAVAGEFGRTPRINKTAGRDHWAPCYTQLLAGGGIRGGQVFGASDSVGAYVKDAPVTPEDYFATIYHAFGVPPETPVYDALNRPHRISPGTPLTSLF